MSCLRVTELTKVISYGVNNSEIKNHSLRARKFPEKKQDSVTSRDKPEEWTFTTEAV